jgi:hypothetical protein
MMNDTIKITGNTLFKMSILADGEFLILVSVSL